MGRICNSVKGVLQDENCGAPREKHSYCTCTIPKYFIKPCRMGLPHNLHNHKDYVKEWGAGGVLKKSVLTTWNVVASCAGRGRLLLTTDPYDYWGLHTWIYLKTHPTVTCGGGRPCIKVLTSFKCNSKTWNNFSRCILLLITEYISLFKYRRGMWWDAYATVWKRVLEYEKRGAPH